MATDHEISAENNVENASHQKFDTLGCVDDHRSKPRSETFPGNGHVRIPNSL